MIVGVSLHGMEEAEIINVVSDVRHQVADPRPRFAILPEAKRAHQNRIVAAVEDIGMPC
jgi:hypothetical protein